MQQQFEYLCLNCLLSKFYAHNLDILQSLNTQQSEHQLHKIKMAPPAKKMKQSTLSFGASSLSVKLPEVTQLTPIVEECEDTSSSLKFTDVTVITIPEES